MANFPARTSPYQYGLWGVGLAVDLATPWLGQRTLQNGPVDTSHLPERLAQFNIVLLGEAVTEVIDGVAKVEWQVTSLGLAFLTFCLAIMI